MLTYQDCVGLSELTEAEIRAIGEHEHIPEIVAAELGAYLVTTPDGENRIRRIILDDIEQAESRKDLKRSLELKAVLLHFMEQHPANPAVLALQK